LRPRPQATTQSSVLYEPPAHIFSRFDSLSTRDSVSFFGHVRCLSPVSVFFRRLTRGGLARFDTAFLDGHDKIESVSDRPHPPKQQSLYGSLPPPPRLWFRQPEFAAAPHPPDGLFLTRPGFDCPPKGAVSRLDFSNFAPDSSQGTGAISRAKSFVHALGFTGRRYLPYFALQRLLVPCLLIKALQLRAPSPFPH